MKFILMKACDIIPEAQEPTLTRNCPKCNGIMKYTTVSGLNKAERKCTTCVECKKKRNEDVAKSKYKRACPTCHVELSYSGKSAYTLACSKNTLCKACRDKKSEQAKQVAHERKCPKCGDNIVYKNKWACQDSENNNRVCRKCSPSVHEKKRIRGRIASLQRRLYKLENPTDIIFELEDDDNE